MGKKIEQVRGVLISEFKGSFPAIPTFEGVDTDALYEGDPDPLHVNLPVAQVGAVSKNGLEYTEWLVEQMEAQLQGLGGYRGHIASYQRSSAYPYRAVHWIGGEMVGDMLWAKGYVPPGADRDDIRRSKASGGSVATSIYGTLYGADDDDDEEVRKWDRFELESIDIVDPKRAALDMSEYLFVTAEMRRAEGANAEELQKPQEDIMGNERQNIIASLSVADIPQHIRQAIEQEVTNELETGQRLKTLTAERDQLQARVTELEKGVGETDKLQKQIKEMQAQLEQANKTLAEHARQSFDSTIDHVIESFSDWQVGAEQQPSLDAFRETFKEAIMVRLPEGKTDEVTVKEIAGSLYESRFKRWADAVVAEAAGPSVNYLQERGISEGRIQIDESPEAMRASAARLGLSIPEVKNG